MTKTKIAVALSGGVDSSLVLYLLQQKGYDVHAFTMLLTEDENKSAQKMAEFLNVPHTIVDLREEFKQEIISYFLRSYELGKTPNPCLVCNRKIKLGRLFDIVKDYGCEYLATGHYAKIIKGNELHKADNEKDQSYFLFNLKYENLPYIMFPLADLTKTQVRELAQKANLPTAEQKESQDVCFICGDYKDFLKGKIENPTGDFVDTEGNVIGKHEGIANYTIGQRRGLKLGGFENPLFVLEIDTKNNNVIVGEHENLLKSNVFVRDVNWLVPNAPEQPFEAMVKLRSRQREVLGIVHPQGNNAKIELKEPFAGVAIGQGACFYIGSQVIGGGFITNDN